jgi:DNA-binding transcriptional MocR family regulator
VSTLTNVQAFVKLPIAILRRKDLTASAKLVYAILAYRGRSGRACPSIRRLADDLGMSDRTVKDAIAALCEAGLLTVDSGQRRHRANVYGVVSTPQSCGVDSAYEVEEDKRRQRARVCKLLRASYGSINDLPPSTWKRAHKAARAMEGVEVTPADLVASYKAHHGNGTSNIDAMVAWYLDKR